LLSTVGAFAQLPSGATWALRYVDEFNETYAGNIMGLDPAKWNSAYPWGRTHNYPAYIRDENILVNTSSNGLLQLWSKRENFGGQPFTSGAINSNGKLNLGLVGRNGYMEARMKMPNYLGTWPAFWALQDGWPPEIDMMEFVRNGAGSPNTSPNKYVANVHFSTPSGNSSSWSDFKDAGKGDLTAAFHNYGVRWTDTTLTWYIDGTQFHSYTGADAIAQMQHMYLILNHGIGGWPGDPPANEDVNKSFDIDWVRVWQAAGPAQTNYVGAALTQQWDTDSNWSAGSPQLASTTAFFGNLTSGSTAILDWTDTRTVGGLLFRSGSNYRLGSTDDHLVLSAWGGGSATEALIDVQLDTSKTTQGRYIIGSRLELHDNARVRNATANVLSFFSDVHGDGSLTLDSGQTSFTGTVYNGGGMFAVGSADASFSSSLGTPSSVIYVGTTAGSNSTLRLLSSATSISASHLRIGDAGGTGTVIQSGGAAVINGGEVWVGQSTGSTGIYNHSGGSLTLSNWLAIGRQGATGTYNLSGTGSITKLGAGNIIIGSLGGVGSLIQSGGSVSVQGGDTLLGEDAGASGSYTITAGSAVLHDIVLSQRGAGNGTFNLNGGTVETSAVRRAGSGTGTFNFNGGVLKPSAANATFMQGLSTAAVKAGGAIVNTNGLDVAIAQPLVHDSALGAAPDGGLTKNGSGTLTVSGNNTYTGPTVASAGKLLLNASLTTSSSLQATGGTIELSAGPSKIIKTAGVVVTNSGKLDLQNNKLAVVGGDLAAITDLIATGRNGGTWDGANGIVTSQSAADTNFTALGVGVASAGQSFGGQVLAAGDVMVMYTYGGDANLDGRINIDDYVKIDSGIAAGLSGWSNGDFNYDGTINIDDYTQFIDANLPNQNGYVFPTASGESALAGVSAIPEPASISMIGSIALILLCARIRRITL
jgi:autotransporter-associated beta strand protein